MDTSSRKTTNSSEEQNPQAAEVIMRYYYACERCKRATLFDKFVFKNLSEMNYDVSPEELEAAAKKLASEKKIEATFI